MGTHLAPATTRSPSRAEVQVEVLAGAPPERPHAPASFDLADTAMAATILIWIGNNIVVTDQVRSIDPLAFVAARFAIVAAVLFPWLLLRRTPLRVARRDLGLLALIGVLGFGAYNALWVVGVTITSAFAASLLIGLAPVVTLVLARLSGMERIAVRQWLGVAVAVAGIVLFVADKLMGNVPVAGDGLALLAALTWATYSLVSRPMSGRYPALTITAWGALIGLVTVLPLALRPIAEEEWAAVGWRGWGAILYSSLFAMLLGYTLWSWGIARRGVGRTVPYLYLVPVGTGLASALFLGESFGPLKVAGALFALAGLALSRSGKPKPIVAPAQPATPLPGEPEHAHAVVHGRSRVETPTVTGGG